MHHLSFSLITTHTIHTYTYIYIISIFLFIYIPLYFIFNYPSTFIPLKITALIKYYIDNIFNNISIQIAYTLIYIPNNKYTHQYLNKFLHKKTYTYNHINVCKWRHNAIFKCRNQKDCRN